MTTISDLINSARLIKATRQSLLSMTYNSVTYNVNDFLTVNYLSFYQDALTQEGSDPRSVLLPSTLLPQTLTNSNVIDFMQMAIEAMQKHLDGYNYIIQQIINGTITDSSQISGLWDSYDSTYINPRTESPTNETLANSITALSQTIATLPTPLQADWNQTDTNLLSYIKNKPSIPSAQVQSNWAQSNSSLVDFIKNKPTIPNAQIQSDWAQTNNSLLDFIKNKPANKSFTYPTRVLNTVYQPSTTQDTFVSSAIDIACTLTLTGGQTGTIIFETADDSGFTTNIQTVNSTANGNTGTLTIGLSLTQTATASVCGGVPKNKYYRLRTVNTTGTPTFTMRSVQEILF